MRKVQIFLSLIALLIVSYLISYYSLNTIKGQGYHFAFRAKKPYDLVVKYVQIVDGTGKEIQVGDIAITDGKIAFIGKVESQLANKVIDGSGLTVLPKLLNWENKGDIVEQSLASAIEIFSSDRIILDILPEELNEYKGLSLWEAALRLEKEPKQLADTILSSNSSSKVLIIPSSTILSNDLVSLTQKLTGFRADVMNEKQRGRILLGHWADLMFFNIENQKEFLDYLKKEEMPSPYWQMERGIINQ